MKSLLENRGQHWRNRRHCSTRLQYNQTQNESLMTRPVAAITLDNTTTSSLFTHIEAVH